MSGCTPIPTATLFATSLSLSPSIYTTTVVLPGTEAGDDDAPPLTQVQTLTSLVPSSRLIPTATLFTTPACDSKTEVDVGGTTRVPVSQASPSLRASATGTQTLTTALTVMGGNSRPSVVVVTLTQTLSQTSATLVLKTAEAPPPEPTQQASTTSSRSSTKAGPIAGGIVGLVAAIAAIAALLLWLRKRARRSRDTRALNDFFNAGAGVGRSTSQRQAPGADDDGDDDDDSATSSGKGRRPTTPGLELERADGDDDGEPWSRDMEEQGTTGWGAHGRTSIVGRPLSPTMAMAPRPMSPVAMLPAAMRPASPTQRPSSIHDALLMREQSSRSVTSQESRQSLLVVAGSSIPGDTPTSLNGAVPLTNAATTPMLQRSAPTSPELGPSSTFAPPGSSPPYVDAFTSYLANGPAAASQSRSLGRNFTVSSTGGGRFSRAPLGMTVVTDGMTTRPMRSESTGSIERPRSMAAMSPISPTTAAAYHRSPRHSMHASQELRTRPRSPQHSPPFAPHRVVGVAEMATSPPRPKSRTSFGAPPPTRSMTAEYPPSRYSHLDVAYPAAVAEVTEPGAKRSSSLNASTTAATPYASLPVSANGSSQGSSSASTNDSPVSPPDVTPSKVETSDSASSLAAYHTSLVKQASEQLLQREGSEAADVTVDGDAEEQRRLERLAAAKLWGLNGALRVANGDAVQTPE